jgi:hypothetical protein
LSAIRRYPFQLHVAKSKKELEGSFQPLQLRKAKRTILKLRRGDSRWSHGG